MRKSLHKSGLLEHLWAMVLINDGCGRGHPGKVVLGSYKKAARASHEGKPVSGGHLCFSFSFFLQAPAQLGFQPWLPSVDRLGAKFGFGHVVFITAT